MISPEEYRAVMRNLVSGVTIVTTEVDGELYGMTATSFTSVSLDPMLVQVSLQQSSRTHEAVKRSGAMGVSILSARQERVARRFAMRGADGFAVSEVETGESGLPLISGAIGHLECRVVEEFEGGDHTIFLAEVTGGKAGIGSPLIHFQGDYYTTIGEEKGTR